MREVLICALLLTACGDGGYWELKNPPVPVKSIVRVDTLTCSEHGARGCWVPWTQSIEIRTHLSASDEACAMRHEKAHAAGWVHPPGMAFVWDCGPKDFLEIAQAG